MRLHGEGLNLLRVLGDGESVAFRHDDGELVVELPTDRDRVVLEIRNTCAPEANTELSGLYTSEAAASSRNARSQGFRRITYFLDRPDVMAVYTRDAARGQDALPHAAVQRQPGGRGTLTAADTSRPGTTRIRSRRTCSRWWAPIWRAASSACARARQGPPAAGVRAPRRTWTRPSTR